MTPRAVLIVGGSMAGVQAALDLANSSLEVCLVEGSPFLGGDGAGMSQHLLASRLLEAVKHPNIKLLTQAKVTQLRGGPGDFQVEVQQHPRYVDLTRCTACGECVPVCPVTVQPGAETAIYKPDNAVPSIFAIADRVIMVDSETKGILARGRPQDLKERSENLRVRQFFNRKSGKLT